MTHSDNPSQNSQLHMSFKAAIDEVHKQIIGQTELVNSLFMALLTGGHLLLEGLPGLAKTLAIKVFSQVVDCQFQRIQFTPDLLPSDLIGTQIYLPHKGEFTVKKGPIFSNLVLADEINRAPAKVQSALLEAMAEKQVTIGDESFTLPEPFLVLATQNPVEQEGTYVLPEAQSDRFLMKIKVEYPSYDEEKKILQNYSVEKAIEVQKLLNLDLIKQAREQVDKVYLDEKILHYILDLVFCSRDPKAYHVDIQGLLEFGASPRASLALAKAAKARAFLEGRDFVTPHDIKTIARGVLRHRLKLSYEAQAEELDQDAIIDRVLESIRVP